ncbi:hypothetical protein NDU88_006437 [Pleurodeles waltl]|uniref:Uncharacterized protein n=1 Tax=Pleurodeles waltl TaxID=8319 RepID=A0AAV7N310_PLEWA|nr:hypothetical protein NDU88_006437 [Pleurodeles waltl]
MFMKCRKETSTPPQTNIWPQGELLQLAVDAQKGLPRAAAANRSGVSSQAAGKKWMVPQGQPRTGTTAQQERAFRNHSHAAANTGMKQGNSNGGSRVGGSACDTQALVASVKMRKQLDGETRLNAKAMMTGKGNGKQDFDWRKKTILRMTTPQGKHLRNVRGMMTEKRKREEAVIGGGREFFE